ncbi:MAG TPA: RNB domain-containing ribonuclease [Actinomycetales bacterium]|nr:RNB domain-containing ribonuclease [Actinomycetales bacterium]
MVHGRVRLTGRDDSAPTAPLDKAFEVIREEAGVPGDFPPEVLAAAADAARAPQLPTRDLTDVPFFTIDPPGSTDLDQAMHLERDGHGFRVRYAIADVPAFVLAGGLVDAEARRRGQTIYAPDQRTPLHPPVISEDAGSLLPGQVRPAFVWDLRLDAEGELTSSDVGAALVRSVDRLDYEGVQSTVEAGADRRLELLRQIGGLRLELEAARGGASLPMPEQEVVETGDGYRLRLRPPVPAEDWNAQISLLTGMAAADMMLAGEVGILRTMPAPGPHELARFHRQAAALGVRWPAELQYGDFLRTLDRDDGRQLALIHEATRLFRGAGYTPFVGAVPEVAEHAAVAAPYAHVTAPLRRLVDRFGLVVCASLCADVDVPGWVTEALPDLPAIMTASDRVAGTVERQCTDAVEVAVLSSRVGEVFDAVVVEVPDQGDGGQVQLLDPPVLAPATGDLTLGASVRVRLTGADVVTRTVDLVPA